MAVTPVSGINLLYWNMLPMGVSTYGGDLQIYNVPDFVSMPFTSYLNPIAEMQFGFSYAQHYGGWSPTPTFDGNAAVGLAQEWLNPVNQQAAGQQFSQASGGASSIKTKLNSMLLNESATAEDRQKMNDYLSEIDKLEKELKDLQSNTEISTQEVFDKSFEIEKQLRNIATDVGNLSSTINQTAQQSSQQAQAVQEPQGAELSKSTQSSSSTPKNSDVNCDLKPGLFKGRLAGHEATVVRICKKYGVSPALVASIIGLESGWGTSSLAMHNNFGGYRAAGDLGKNAKGFGYFSTVEKGLEAMIKNLASYDERFSDVKAVDFANIDAIAKHYCSPEWARHVKNMYNTRVKKYLA